MKYLYLYIMDGTIIYDIYNINYFLMWHEFMYCVLNNLKADIWTYMVYIYRYHPLCNFCGRLEEYHCRWCSSSLYHHVIICLLTVCNAEILVIFLGQFQQPAMFQCQGIMWNTNMMYLFSDEKCNSTRVKHSSCIDEWFVWGPFGDDQMIASNMRKQ